MLLSFTIIWIASTLVHCRHTNLDEKLDQTIEKNVSPLNWEVNASDEIMAQLAADLKDPVSPCPDVFRYDSVELASGKDYTYGIITIPYHGQKYLKLQVNMSMAGFPGRGRAKIKTEILNSIQGLVNGDEPDLTYIVLFPVQYSIPIVTSIAFNNKRVCMGSKYTLDDFDVRIGRRENLRVTNMYRLREINLEPVFRAALAMKKNKGDFIVETGE